MPQFEQILESTLDKVFDSSDEGYCSNLFDSVKYSVLSPGKRLRPQMLLACGALLEIDEKKLYPLAVSLEMVHCFTLIHDDLPCMDDDDLRRGRPSNHKVYGDGVALLAGDSLMALAVDSFMLASDEFDSKSFSLSLKRLIKAMGPLGVIGGQAQEMQLDQNLKLEDLCRVYRLKTGALFEAAVMIPFELSRLNRDSSLSMLLRDFAVSFGVAFQIADDLDDKTQDSHSFGLFSVSGHERWMSDRVLEFQHNCRKLESLFPQNNPLLELVRPLLLKLKI